MSRSVDPAMVPRRRRPSVDRPASSRSRSASPPPHSVHYARPGAEHYPTDRASSSATPPYPPVHAHSHHAPQSYHYQQHTQLPPLSYYDNNPPVQRQRLGPGEGYFASGYAYHPPLPPMYGYHQYAPVIAPPPPRLEHAPTPHTPTLAYVHHGYPAAPSHIPPPPPPPPPENEPGEINWTDDAATKLTASVRRRCFNCCTTKTCTWRRSLLSAGKVLCNKCGLFERTHSRPRPDQFSGKRSIHPPPVTSGQTAAARGRPAAAPAAVTAATSHMEPSSPRTRPDSSSGQGDKAAPTTYDVPASGSATQYHPAGPPLAPLLPGGGATAAVGPAGWNEKASLPLPPHNLRVDSPPSIPAPKMEAAPVATARPGLRSLLNSPEAPKSRLPVKAQ